MRLHIGLHNGFHKITKDYILLHGITRDYRTLQMIK